MIFSFAFAQVLDLLAAWLPLVLLKVDEALGVKLPQKSMLVSVTFANANAPVPEDVILLFSISP